MKLNKQDRFAIKKLTVSAAAVALLAVIGTAGQTVKAASSTISGPAHSVGISSDFHAPQGHTTKPMKPSQPASANTPAAEPSQSASSEPTVVNISAPNVINDTSEAAAEHGIEQDLMSNSYLYDETGKRANGLILRAKSQIVTYGTKTIAGIKFYLVKDQDQVYYIPAQNVTGSRVKLSRSAKIYNKKGKRVKKAKKLRKNKVITVYGAKVRLHGKKYYSLGNGKYIRAAKVAISHAIPSSSQSFFGEKVIHNSYLYDETGKRIGKVVLAPGSIITGDLAAIGQDNYYKVGNYYLAAANVKEQIKR